MEEIMEKKIIKTMKEKSLLDQSDVMIEPTFSKEILEYLSSIKLNPLTINPYDNTKDFINHIQTFQSHMYYTSAFDVIMCQTFPIMFKMAASNWYITLKSNSFKSFNDFAQQFIAHFANNYKPYKTVIPSNKEKTSHSGFSWWDSISSH